MFCIIFWGFRLGGIEHAVVVKHALETEVLVYLRPVYAPVGQMEIATLLISSICQPGPFGKGITRASAVFRLGIYVGLIYPHLCDVLSPYHSLSIEQELESKEDKYRRHNYCYNR